MIKKEVGNNLKSLREKRKYKGKTITQEKVAESVKISVRYYQSLEKGKNFPSAELFERFAKFYSIQYGELFGYQVSLRTRLIELILDLKDSDVKVVIETIYRLTKK